MKASCGDGRDLVRILVLAWLAPATASMPGSPRLFSLCRELCGDHTLELLLMPQDAQHVASFRDDPEVARVFSEIDELPAPPAPSWLQRQTHRLRQEPYFSLRALAPRYHARICSEVRKRCTAADLLIADGLAATQYVRDVPVPAVADLHDAVSLLFRRSAERAESPLERVKLRLESRSLARWERRLRRHFGLVITNSDVDRDEIRRLDPRCNAIAIPNGVDTAYFSPGRRRRRARVSCLPELWTTDPMTMRRASSSAKVVPLHPPAGARVPVLGRGTRPEREPVWRWTAPPVSGSPGACRTCGPSCVRPGLSCVRFATELG